VKRLFLFPLIATSSIIHTGSGAGKQFKEKQAREEEDKAKLARERGWCDDSVSDKLAAEIYRERTYPWLSYREKPVHPRSSNGS
jgi:hypothetical protein